MGTSEQWPQDGAAAGGVGTITRPAAAPDAGPELRGRPRQEAAPRVHPRRAGRIRAARRVAGHAGGTPAPDTPVRAAPRMPFFVLLCVLLGLALVCALVITTTLAAGSFQITRLQEADGALARQQQLLLEQVATAQSAQVIEQRALRLGMRPDGELQFIDLKTGEISSDAGGGTVAAIDVPGYTP